MAPSHHGSKPAAWVVRFAPLVADGAAVLDLACGAGRHARFFLERGHPVTALDIDTSALEDLRSHPSLEIVQADLEDGSPWPLAGRTFGAVVVMNYLWRPLFPPILESIADGGLLLYETFACGNAAYGRPANPDFLLEPGELIEVVRGHLQIVAYESGHIDLPQPAVKQRLCAVRSDAPMPLWPAPAAKH